MKIKYLIICIILTLVSLSKVFACHKTGDSNCTPISNSLSNSSEATDEKHDNVANYNDNDTNSDPKGFFTNNPYKKTSLKNSSIGSSVREINNFRSKEEVKNLISKEISKLSSEDLRFNNINKLSFLLKSIKDTIRKDTSISLSEKDTIINNVDDLRDKYLKKMQKTMLIKYDFGYFLSDLSRIISLPVENLKNKSSYLSKITNLLLRELNNQQDEMKESKINSAKFNEKIENINKKINDLDYINKLYVLLEPKRKKNNSSFQQNINKINQSKLDKKEVELLIKSLNKNLKTTERKINNDSFKSQFNFEKNKVKYEVNQIKKQIEDIKYISKVFDLIGDKN